MEPTTVIFATFGFYLILLLGIGVWADRRFGKSYEGFITANRSLGAWVTAISAAASSESGWVMLGLSGLGYAKGLAAYWASIGGILGFAVTSLFVVRQLHEATGEIAILTLGDYLSHRLDDRLEMVRYHSSLLIGVFMLVYVVAQFVSAGKQIAGMGLADYRTGVLLGAVVIGIYVFVGGYAAVCWSDLIQGLMMVVTMVGLPVLAALKSGNFGRVVASLGESSRSSGNPLTWAATGFAVGQLGIGIGYPGMPHSVIRFVTVRDKDEARKAAWIGFVYGTLILLAPVTLGIIGRALIPGLEDAEHILPAFTAQFLPPVLSGVMLAAVSAAIMSTADSQLMMAATSLVHDLWGRVLRRSDVTPMVQDREHVLQTRVIIGLLALVAMGLALLDTQVIYTFVLFAWGALGAAFTPVILLSLYWRRFNWQGALGAMIVGPVTVVVWKLAGLSEYLYEMIPAATLSTLVAILLARLTQD